MWDVIFAYWMTLPFYFILKHDRPHLFKFEKRFGKYGFLFSFAIIAVLVMHIKLVISAIPT